MVRYLLGRSRVGVRWLCACVLIVVSANTWALGLGEIELNSALNEELDATIELLDASGLSPLEIRVSLASNEDFERVGVERFFFLTDLSFEVTYGSSGDARVVVSSSRPITEPYLNFIVEVLWPSGRLLKEFTLLLDPPTFSAAAAPAVSAPVEPRRATNTAGRVQREAPATRGTQVQVAPARPAPRQTVSSPLDQDVVGDEFRMTDRNDTLWSIAARTRGSNAVSVQQTMLAIQRLNPDAFIKGNINLLKAGYSLKLPSEAEAQNLSQNEALQVVARQNQDWKAINRGEAVAEATPAAGEPVASTSATGTSATGTSATGTSADSTSTLRSPVDATAAPTSEPSQPATEGELRIVAADGDSATGVASAGDLTAAQEENDRLALEIDELTYQLDQEKELAQNQITVKDRQLEVKNQEIAQLQQQLADARQAAAQQPASQAPEAQAPQTQNQSTSAWWESPLVLYGGAGVLVLALVGGMLAARRGRETEDDFYEAEAEDDGQQEPFISDDEEFAGEADEALDDAYGQAEDDVDAVEEELPGSETSDVIGEADIYIAYGRYPQAIGLLLGVLEDDPGRNDVRLKVLELYSETNDRDAFDEHMAKLVEHCDEQEALLAARELESQFGEKSISLDEVLAEGNQADDREELSIAADEGLSTDSNIDDDGLADLEFSPADTDLDETATEELDIAGADDAEAEFELELDELDETVAETDAGAADELGGDLGIDFNPDRDVAEDSGAEENLETLAMADVDTSTDLSDTEVEPSSADEDHIDLDDVGLGTELDTVTTGADSGASAFAEEELDGDLAVAEEDEFDFQEEGDSANTKLDLARAYIDMGDADGARDILKEVLDEGNSEQQQQAQSMLEAL